MGDYLSHLHPLLLKSNQKQQKKDKMIWYVNVMRIKLKILVIKIGKTNPNSVFHSRHEPVTAETRNCS